MDLLQFSNSHWSSVRNMQSLLLKQYKTNCIRNFKIHIENDIMEISIHFILRRYSFSFSWHLLGNTIAYSVLLAKAPTEIFKVFVFLCLSTLKNLLFILFNTEEKRFSKLAIYLLLVNDATLL